MLMFVAFLMALCGALRPVCAADTNWAAIFNVPGANGTVHAVVEGIGGDFTAIGNIAANCIARYDKITRAVSPLGSGVDYAVNARDKVGFLARTRALEAKRSVFDSNR